MIATSISDAHLAAVAGQLDKSYIPSSGVCSSHIAAGRRFGREYT